MMVRTFQAAMVCLAAGCAAQENKCAQFGLSPTGGANGYQWRDNRCEGVFAQSVGGTLDVRLISFARGLAVLNPQDAKTLRVTWPAAPPRSEPVQIRAISLRFRHYYRMDATAPASVTSFGWATDALRSERLTGAELGVVGWTSMPVGKQVYLPLSVEGAAAPLEARLVAGTELRELYYSVRQLTPEGKAGRIAVAEKERGLSSYPAGRAIPLALPAGLEAGFYRLDVSATGKTSGTVAKEFVVYVPGPKEQ
jgi:hypothetical protein